MPYQARLAQDPRFPRMLEVPTGLGKTAAIVLAWLYRLRAHPDPEVQAATPRRLVYCLPMRVLVEQTEASVKTWVSRLAEAGALGDAPPPGIHLLMGGALDESWEGSPEESSILIGTQDQLLSRALNRGYGMSRYRWPMHFAMLNNDALWVCDEVQLMGVGLLTASQLDGFRSQWGTYGSTQTLWMSATLDPKALELPDARPVRDEERFRLDDADRAHPLAQKRLKAQKALLASSLRLEKATEKSYARDLARAILDTHQANSLSLVILNRVSRAQAVFTELQRLIDKQGSGPALGLIHSRMRPIDRARHEALLIGKDTPGNRIVVATQAVEAGVDVSARTLFTELAPWSSLVQRLGRLNRYGEHADARAFWIDLSQEDNFVLPYALDDLARARAHLTSLSEAGPEALSSITESPPASDAHVLRAKDLLDLFDTAPDVAGHDLDISRYIRDSDDLDVQLYWKAFENAPSERESWNPRREELCGVGIHHLRKFLKKSDAWIWDPLHARWQMVKESSVRPGMTLLLAESAGGYAPDLGWTGDPTDRPAALPSEPEEIPHAFDPDTYLNRWVSLREHSLDAREEARMLRGAMSDRYPDLPWSSVETAAWRHDHGKAHAAFQNMLDPGHEAASSSAPWAKSDRSGRATYWLTEGKVRQERPGFRHELASALAWLVEADDHEEANLIAYLMAAHHGKVRMSLRSHPDEQRPEDPDRLHARGVWHGDIMPEVDLGDNLSIPACELRLDIMNLGLGAMGPSWLERTLALRDRFGPFKLAYLETLVRVSDWRASRKERHHVSR